LLSVFGFADAAVVIFQRRCAMHFKRIPVILIKGDAVALMIFARSLALLPLPIGCLALR
jgi:hypothetical protein